MSFRDPKIRLRRRLEIVADPNSQSGVGIRAAVADLRLYGVTGPDLRRTLSHAAILWMFAKSST